MTEDPDDKKRWFRSRQAKAVVVALILVTLPLGYPLLVGPAAYSLERDWISSPVFAATCAPALNALPRGSSLQYTYFRYINWWLRLAEKHDGHRYYYLVW
jgi:hypothetical protein